MQKQFIASAPGKILWLGGYSVLEKGKVAYVSIVDKRVFVKSEKKGNGKIELHSPQFKIKLQGELTNGKISLRDFSEEQKKKARFLISALECSLKYAISKSKKIGGIKLTAINNAAFGKENEKTGLGSSAAVTVATIASILGLHGFDIENDKIKRVILNLGFISHSQAQGKVGSGFDIAAAVFGSCTYLRFSPSFIERAPKTAGSEFALWMEMGWDCSIDQRVKFPTGFIPVIAYTNSSTSTSEMVLRINEYKSKYPDYYKSMVDAINEANLAAISCMQTKPPMLAAFKESFDDGRMLTKKLGDLTGAEIESANMTRLIDDSMKNGAFVCKLPGAGGGDSIGAICLTKKDAAKLRAFWKKKKLKILDVGFGGEGVKKGGKVAFRQAPK